MIERLVIAGLLFLAGSIGGYWFGQREQPQPVSPVKLTQVNEGPVMLLEPGWHVKWMFPEPPGDSMIGVMFVSRPTVVAP